MSDPKHPPKRSLDNVIRFPVEGVRRKGFTRAKALHGSAMERQGQLSLFGERPAGEVLSLPSRMGLFEEAMLLDERGDAGATEAYRRAIDANDSIADAYCNLGIKQSEVGKTVEAFDSFTQSLANEPRHFESHYNMANLYFEVGDLRLARTHYEIAASINPEFPNVYFNLGLVHAMSESFEAAIEALSAYRTLASNDDLRIADELLDTLRRSVSRKPNHS
jgi:tetratricopeptide (TPR) repeat protein